MLAPVLVMVLLRQNRQPKVAKRRVTVKKIIFIRKSPGYFIQGRRHGVDWGGHFTPLLPECVREINADPLSLDGRSRR